jgi:hypothetical protein
MKRYCGGLTVGVAICVSTVMSRRQACPLNSSSLDMAPHYDELLYASPQVFLARALSQVSSA